MHSFFFMAFEKGSQNVYHCVWGHGELDVIKSKYGMTLNALSYTDLPLRLYFTACKTALPQVPYDCAKSRHLQICLEIIAAISLNQSIMIFSEKLFLSSVLEMTGLFLV